MVRKVGISAGRAFSIMSIQQCFQYVYTLFKLLYDIDERLQICFRIVRRTPAFPCMR